MLTHDLDLDVNLLITLTLNNWLSQSRVKEVTVMAGKHRSQVTRVVLAAFALQMAIPVIAYGSTDSPLTEKKLLDPALDPNILCGKIRDEIVNLPQSASTEDYEASIIFVLSQENPEREVMDAALDCVEAPKTTTAALKKAITNIRLAMLKKKLKIGTAALGGGGGGLGIDGFPVPLVSVGGGTANYTS
jgi:hypothetical protein